LSASVPGALAASSQWHPAHGSHSTFLGTALVLAVALAAASAAAAAEAPEQFRVWGAQVKPHPYFKVLEGAAAPPETTAVSPGDEARGFVVHPASPAEPLAPRQGPAGGTSLEARDCPGQYGPIAFTLRPLADTQCSVTVTDLAGPRGTAIGAENFDVRVVRAAAVTYKDKREIVPLVLEPFGGRLPGNRTQTFWITYHVPPAAPAGTYEGKVRVVAGGREKAAIPLRLEVYPFALAEPAVSLYMYYNNGTEAADMPAAARQLADQRCHGMNLAPLELPITREGDMSREAVAPWLDLYAKAGFARKFLHVGLWNRITSEWLNVPDKSIGMWGPWFRYYPFSERLDRRYVETVRMLRDEAKRRGLELVLSVADEAGSHPWTTEATQHYNALVRRDVPDVLRELSVGGGWAMDRPEHELWKGLLHVWTTNRWLPDKLDLVRQGDPKALIGIYNMGGDGSGPGGPESVRAMFGFFAWKVKAAAAAQWVYYHNATPECNYTWPAADPSQGHVPTVRWEMVREGAKDRRYIETLQGRLAGKTGPAADEARAFLDEVAAKVELRTDAYDPIGGGRVRVQPPGTYDAWRDRIAGFIGRLGP
jgi:hypothetical protein